MLSVLASHGYSMVYSSDLMDIAVSYYNAVFRRIPVLPRTIKKSDVFACPSGHEAGLANLEQKICDGDDLTPHLSRGLKNTDGDDDLLSDWGVYHLHMGIVTESDGFMARTGPVLFAIPTDNRMHFIQVYAHGNWSNRDVLEIVHRNWPEILAPFSPKGVVDISMNPDSEDIAKLRKTHINTSLKMSDGTIYFSPGWGMMTDGTSARVVFAAQKGMKEVARWDKLISSQPSTVLSALKDAGHDGEASVHFSLSIEPTGVFAVAGNWPLRVKLA